MKVIDILNKIANGEQPNHIRIYNEDWYWNDYGGYVDEWSLNTTPDAQTYLFDKYRLFLRLDKEVEIIEDTPKNIEKLNGILEFRQDGNHFSKLPNNEELMFKINEIIDYINRGNE